MVSESVSFAKSRSSVTLRKWESVQLPLEDRPYLYDSRMLTSTDRKKADKSTGQNIPFNIQFTEKQPTMLSVGYTPAGASAKYGTIWTDSATFDTNKTHNIALAWDTTAGNNANKLQMW